MSARERILIIEDEELIRYSLHERLESEGYRVEEAETCAEGLRRFLDFHPDLVLLDFRLPDGDGLEILRQIHAEDPQTVIIMMTGHGNLELAIKAIKAGAYTYINKPFDLEDVVAHVSKGLETTALRREVETLRKEQAERDGGFVMIAESARMQGVLETIEKVNEADAPTLLLLGESGVGKDLLARRIHGSSHRASGPFQNITCTAIPDTLLESELFGHERGAFTDAKQRKQGLLELADGGTVFLDEIGDMSLALQAKMLRFLEERAFRRVGGTTDIRVNVRIIAATNRNLEEAVRAEQFRQDLFYRISVIPITVPPLRDRSEDVGPLAELFAERFAREFKRPFRALDDAAREALVRHAWPGNVRELRNVIERAMILGSGKLIALNDLPPEIRRRPEPSAQPPAEARGDDRFELPAQGLVFEELERDLVLQALRRTRYNQTQAARLLGMTRDQIRYRVEKFKISTDAQPESSS